MLRWLIGIILAEIICESSNWQHIQRLKITILGANWQRFRLERIAKCSYFIWSTQNIKFHWIVMKIKKFLLAIWWYNRDLFPLRNKYNMVFVLGMTHLPNLVRGLEKKYGLCNMKWQLMMADWKCWIHFYNAMFNWQIKKILPETYVQMLLANKVNRKSGIHFYYASAP